MTKIRLNIENPTRPTDWALLVQLGQLIERQGWKITSEKLGAAGGEIQFRKPKPAEKKSR